VQLNRRARRRRARARRRRAAKRSALRALTSSALALPGLAAADGPGGYEAVYDYSRYMEDDLKGSKVAPGGERSRYEIDIHQIHLGAPIAGRFELGLDLVHESMSGATPWYVIPDASGDPVQVMTGATVEDRRTDALVTGSYYLDSGRASLGTGISVEEDYLALNGNLSGEWSVNEKNTTLLGGAGFSVDELEPTDAESDPLRPRKEDKQSFSVFGGIAQVVTRASALQTTLAYQHGRGFLSDPYKRVVVEGEPIADARPERRHQVSWLTRYRHHFSKLDGSLHADYRFYVDDWQMTSHTLELAWHQSLFHTLRLIPSLRYYSQSQAEFYGPFFDGIRADGHYSSDYRLSPYGAISWRLKAETVFELMRVDWRATFAWERYLADGGFALGKVSVENPGLVSFHMFTMSLSARF
jgi:hypothetical protein